MVYMVIPDNGVPAVEKMTLSGIINHKLLSWLDGVVLAALREELLSHNTNRQKLVLVPTTYRCCSLIFHCLSCVGACVTSAVMTVISSVTGPLGSGGSGRHQSPRQGGSRAAPTRAV
jgi:hypothetical protein